MYTCYPANPIAVLWGPFEDRIFLSYTILEVLGSTFPLIHEHHHILWVWFSTFLIIGLPHILISFYLYIVTSPYFQYPHILMLCIQPSNRTGVWRGSVSNVKSTKCWTSWIQSVCRLFFFFMNTTDGVCGEILDWTQCTIWWENVHLVEELYIFGGKKWANWLC